MDKSLTPYLRTIALFERLTAAELESLADSCILLRFKKASELLAERESTSDVFFVLDGAVRVKSYSESGKEISYSDIETGGVFGEFSAVDHLPRSAAVVALSDGLMARMAASRFVALLQADPTLAFKLVELLVAKVRSMSERVFELSALSVRERVRRELIRLIAEVEPSPDGSVVVKPAPTHYEIAARIGSHREAVTREFARLQGKGVLETLRQEIRVPNPARLARVGK